MPKQTALVTGASAGLGGKFAELFAADGHDVVLVARDQPRLEALAERLRAKGVAAHVVVADLALATAPRDIAASVSKLGLSIDYLVNNAGFGFNGTFLDLPLEKELSEIEVNCSAVVALTHIFGNQMRLRGSGRIINVASTAGFQPGPYMATYYATKAFVISFTEAVAYELQKSGVTVTCYCPGATATEFASRAGLENAALFKNRARVADAGEVAEHGYRAMMDGTVLSIPGALNWFGAFLVRLSPRSMVRAIAASLNRPISAEVAAPSTVHRQP